MEIRRQFDRRWIALCVGAILFSIVFFAEAGIAWASASYCLLSNSWILLFWLLSALGWGIPIFHSLGRKAEDCFALRFVTSAALGLGVLSLLTLILGLLGWLNQITAIIALTIGIALLIVYLIRNRNSWDPADALESPAKTGWLWVLLSPLMALAVLAALIPPGILWGDEPNGYDVTEYHLQVPREWFEAGQILPLHHNVFSYMPFNVEMHYLLAMHLSGGPWAGMYLAQLMHLAFCVLSIVAVFGLAGGGMRGHVAGAIMASVPWMTYLGTIAYDEGGILLFGTLAIGWGLRAKNIRQFLLAGIFAGLAAGVKYPVAPLVCVALPAVMLFFGILPVRQRVLGVAVFCLSAILIVSPWLIRNTIWTGNPVFPEAMNLLGKAHFSNVQAERWREAYWPDKDHRSISGRITAFGEQVVFDSRYGFLLIPLALAILAASLWHGRPASSLYTSRATRILTRITRIYARLLLSKTAFFERQRAFEKMCINMRRPAHAIGVHQPDNSELPNPQSSDAIGTDKTPVPLGGILLLLLFQIVLWIGFTHLQSRFIVMAIPLIALLVSQYDLCIWRFVGPYAAVAMIVIGTGIVLAKFQSIVDGEKLRTIIGIENLKGLHDLDNWPPDRPLNLVGDARAFWYPISMNLLHYKTVFDVDTSEDFPTAEQAWLAGMPINGKPLIDADELKRLSKTYYRIPPP